MDGASLDLFVSVEGKPNDATNLMQILEKNSLVTDVTAPSDINNAQEGVCVCMCVCVCVCVCACACVRVYVYFIRISPHVLLQYLSFGDSLNT